MSSIFQKKEGGAMKKLIVVLVTVMLVGGMAQAVTIDLVPVGTGGDGDAGCSSV